MFELFERSWKGEESLAKAYWLVHALFGFILTSIIFILLIVHTPNLNSQTALPGQYSMIAKSVGAITFPYAVFSAICVWRCAKNSHFLWNILAKLLVSINVLAGLFNVFHLIHK